MLGASQFVHVVLFQFSGPDKFSSAPPLLRSFSCSFGALRCSLPVEVALKLISAVHAKRLTHRFKVMGAVNQGTFQGEEAAGCRAAVYFTGCAI
jgi:hypothetical protein